MAVPQPATVTTFWSALTAFWTYVPATLFSTAVSTCVAYRTGTKTVQRTELSARVDDLSKDLRELSNDVRSYWSDDLDPAKLQSLALAIKLNFHSVNEQLQALRGRPKLPAFRQDDLDMKCDRIFEVATDGDFDSPTRAVDIGRAIEAVKQVEILRRGLNYARLRSL